MKNETRVFFVVDSIEDNEELFETLESAKEYLDTLSPKDKPRVRVCIVRHAHKEPEGSWNYTDLSDTFEEIKTL